MKHTRHLPLICAAALGLGPAFAGAADVAPSLEARAKAPRATATVPAGPVAAAPGAHLADPTILSPRGFAAEELPAYDDFLHRAVANKRIEIVRFVDRKDRRVFLGITKEGYLGVHVQKRDR